MSGNTTRRMISAYFQEAAPTAFFSGMFSARPENFYNSEEIEIDIVRSGEDVSIVVQDIAAGYRANAHDIYVNKSFKAPVHKESFPINAYDLIKRVPGDNPFANPDLRMNVIARMYLGMRTVERKIRRAIELQASQVMQTATVTLTDQNGTSLYTLNYAPKATHFPTSGTSWATATTAQKIADISSLGEVIRGDGLANPDQLIFGISAWENLMQDAGFQARLETRRAELGTITPPSSVGEGATYRGTLDFGNYRYDCFTYGGRYKHPQTGASTPFMAPGKIISRYSGGRMDASFGAIPNIGQLLGGGQQVIPEMPNRMSSSATGIDMFTNIWLGEGGESLIGGVGARPLMIPTAIDTYGCLNTQLT